MMTDKGMLGKGFFLNVQVFFKSAFSPSW